MIRIDHSDVFASKGTLDPWVRLAAGVLVQACVDLGNPDPVVAIDALAFWLDPTAGVAWLDALEIVPEHNINGAFRAVVKAGKHATKRKLSRIAA